jgi:hypothetical protein
MAAMIVSYWFEMLNDSKFFKEQAEEVDGSPEKIWIYWRNLRASILFSFTAFEAYINSYAVTRISQLKRESLVDLISNKVNPCLDHRKQMGGIDTTSKDELINKIKKAKLSWSINLNVIIPYLLAELNPEVDTKKGLDHIKKRADEIAKIRNVLAHCPSDFYEVIYTNSNEGVSIETAKKSIQFTTEAIRQLFILTEGKSPEWLDCANYSIIQ